jgi:hypothetical protein
MIQSKRLLYRHITYDMGVKDMIAGSGVLYQSWKAAYYMWLAMEMEEKSNWNVGKFVSDTTALKAFEIAGDICTEENGLYKN